MTAMVAGTAPSSRMIASTLRAMLRLPGKGMPWVMMVDSSATTAAPRALAAATSLEYSIGRRGEKGLVIADPFWLFKARS